MVILYNSRDIYTNNYKIRKYVDMLQERVQD